MELKIEEFVDDEIDEKAEEQVTSYIESITMTSNQQ